MQTMYLTNTVSPMWLHTSKCTDVSKDTSRSLMGGLLVDCAMHPNLIIEENIMYLNHTNQAPSPHANFNLCWQCNRCNRNAPKHDPIRKIWLAVLCTPVYAIVIQFIPMNRSNTVTRCRASQFIPINRPNTATRGVNFSYESSTNPIN